MISISAISVIRNKSLYRNDEKVFSHEGTLNEFLDAAYAGIALDYPKYYKMDRLSRLGILAAEVLLNKNSIVVSSPESTAVVLSNAHASQDTDERYHQTLSTAASPSLFVYTLPNIVIGEICIRHNLKGENAFFVAPAFDADLLSSYVTMVMEQDHIQACVAGWVDVLHEHHDVFLYLAVKNREGVVPGHTAEQLNNLYHSSTYGTTDGRP